MLPNDLKRVTRTHQQTKPSMTCHLISAPLLEMQTDMTDVRNGDSILDT